MLFSLESIVLVLVSMTMVGLGIVTHKGSHLRLWFSSVYEGIPLLLDVVM